MTYLCLCLQSLLDYCVVVCMIPYFKTNLLNFTEIFTENLEDGCFTWDGGNFVMHSIL